MPFELFFAIIRKARVEIDPIGLLRQRVSLRANFATG